MVASSFTVVPATNPKLPYDPERDLAPIVMVAKNSLLFLVNPKVPANSLAEFVALAKANPGKLNYASPGAATQTHLVVELFSQRADIKLQHIPYRGGAPAMTAMVAGDTQFTAISTLLSLPQPGRRGGTEWAHMLRKEIGEYYRLAAEAREKASAHTDPVIRQ